MNEDIVDPYILQCEIEAFSHMIRHADIKIDELEGEELVRHLERVIKDYERATRAIDRANEYLDRQPQL